MNNEIYLEEPDICLESPELFDLVDVPVIIGSSVYEQRKQYIGKKILQQSYHGSDIGELEIVFIAHKQHFTDKYFVHSWIGLPKGHRFLAVNDIKDVIADPAKYIPDWDDFVEEMECDHEGMIIEAEKPDSLLFN